MSDASKVRLPPFPVDDQTLDLLTQAINPEPSTSERSSISDLCVLYSELAGSDLNAVESVADDIQVMRDPLYHPNTIILALVEEVRRLRAGQL